MIASMLRYRYLFGQLVRRELRQKYQGSSLGVLWYLVQPLALMAAYGVILGPLLHAVQVPDYPVFILAGLLVWLFFSQALVAASTSLVDQAALVSKVRFPRQSIPAAAVTVQLVPFATMLAVLLVLAVTVRPAARPELLLVVPLVVCLFAFTLGLALIVSILHSHFRDVQPVLGAALLPWFFVSGVLFRLSSLPGLRTHAWIGPILRWVNPVAPFVEAARNILYDGRVPSAPTLLYVAVAASLSLGLGLAVFGRMQRELAVVL